MTREIGMLNRPAVERLLEDVGFAINTLGGGCAFAEGVLCRTTTLCVELLCRFDEEEGRRPDGDDSRRVEDHHREDRDG